ncbi:hypothetical protein F8388_022073 [Cannabis sativa]|uniref:RNase H type-1 domain-containing protein n=1 Tax=Cannabis sativa TaxID=3483 RepID=A0A7J6G7N5_CANSA|nr:hypothetical protein F8388_022073 [Cannabis sativa]
MERLARFAGELIEPGFGSWLKVDDKRSSYNSSPVGSYVLNTHNSAPPGFPEKRNQSSYDYPLNSMINNDHRPINLSSMGQSRRTTVDPLSSSSSFLLGNKDKGKKVLLSDSVDGKAVENLNSLDEVNSRKGIMEEVIGAGSNKVKRSGSWRDEDGTSSGDISSLKAVLPNYPEQTQKLKNMMIDPNTLMDVPITYDTGYLLDLHLGSNQTTQVTPAAKPDLQWIPPPTNFFIVNTDASLVVGQPGVSLSAVIRDSEGSLVVAEADFTPSCSSVLLAEAAAIVLGLKLALRWSISRVKICSDNQTIIQALQQDALNCAEWGQIVQQAIHLSESFHKVCYLD